MDSKSCKIPVLQSRSTKDIKGLKDDRSKPTDKNERSKPIDNELDDDAMKISSMSYESMRLLVERRDRDLNELREFANIERESLESQLFEQQQQIDLHMSTENSVNSSHKNGVKMDEERSSNNEVESNKVRKNKEQRSTFS